MRPNDRKTIHMKVEFPDRSLARPALEVLHRDRGLSVTILRGRVTNVRASFELKVTGSLRKVEDVIRLGTRWGAFLFPVSSYIA